MVSLNDIGDLGAVLTIRTRKGPVDMEMRGLPAQDLFDLFNEFPEIRKLMKGDPKMKAITGRELLGLGRKVTATVIAMSMRERPEIDEETSNEEWNAEEKLKAVRICSKFSPAEQLKALNLIFEMTFPEGVGPFVVQLRELTATFNGIKAGLAAVSEETTGSSTGSALPSIAGLTMDSHDKRRGPLHHVN